MKNRNLEDNDNWKIPASHFKVFDDEFDFNFFPAPYHNDIEKWDGLKGSWGDRNWINPPYSRKLKDAFVMKAIEESKKGKLCVMLLPVSTSTYLFHDHILPNITRPVRFLFKRIPFIGINKDGELVNWHLWDTPVPKGGVAVKKNGQHDSMIVVFDGRKDRRHYV